MPNEALVDTEHLTALPSLGPAQAFQRIHEAHLRLSSILGTMSITLVREAA